MEQKVCSSCVKEPVGQINVARVIKKLDECFLTDDLAAACECVEYWAHEAEALGDTRGLLSVVNEQLGLYRRTNDKDKGLRAVENAVRPIEETEQGNLVSGATIFVNAATTLKAFGKAADGLSLYEKAKVIYEQRGLEKSFEYAALLNNCGSALSELNRFDKAENLMKKAIEILKEDGTHDGEIAVSLINLAHLYYDRDDTSQREVEKLLDEAWEYINSPRQPHDANYAFILSKCAPSLKYFHRFDEAEAITAVANEIYGKKQ